MPDSLPPAEDSPTQEDLAPSPEGPVRTFEYGFPERRGRGDRLLAVAIVFLPAAAVGALVFVLMWLFGPGADGGRDADRQTAAFLAIVLALTGDTGAPFDEYVGALPEGLPEAVPQYPRAGLVVSYRIPGPDADTFLVVSRTSDGVTQVLEHFREALDTDPWQVEGGSFSAGLSSLQFSSIEDPDLQGGLNIRRSNDGETTAILAFLQAPSDGDGGQPALAQGQELPPGFPEDVPPYDDAVITDTAFFKEPGGTQYYASMLTSDDAGEVFSFYRDVFSDLGWNADESDTPDGGTVLLFDSGNEEIGGSVQAGPDVQREGYTRIDLVVTVATGAGGE